jgi:lipoprotein-releasing system permease protein
MKNMLSNSRVLWSVRDVMRRPLEWFLLTISLALITAIPATALFLVQGLTGSAAHILADSPSLVIRKIDPTGWEPVPVEQSLQAVGSVPGVLRAYARVWGVVAGPGGPLTVVAPISRAPGDRTVDSTLPQNGKVLIGAGAVTGSAGSQLTLSGRTTKTFQISGVIDPTSAMVSHDLVVLNPLDARRLLGLPAGYASDIAIDVFHEEEETAILPDLAEALPWPVRITTRSEQLKFLSGSYARRGGIIILATLPALAAICLLVAATVREHLGNRLEVGLLKAFGWTTANIVRHFLFRSLFIGVPAVCAGLVIAFAAVFSPGVQWPGVLLFGWQGQAPALHLHMGGIVLTLVQMIALTLVPFLIATLVPVLKVATTDTDTCFDRGVL